jgi:hypothetical protein
MTGEAADVDAGEVGRQDGIAGDSVIEPIDSEPDGVMAAESVVNGGHRPRIRPRRLAVSAAGATITGGCPPDPSAGLTVDRPRCERLRAQGASGGQPHRRWPAGLLQSQARVEHPVVMTPTSNLDRATLRAVLAVERELRRGESEPAHAHLFRLESGRAESGSVRSRAGRD